MLPLYGGLWKMQAENRKDGTQSVDRCRRAGYRFPGGSRGIVAAHRGGIAGQPGRPERQFESLRERKRFPKRSVLVIVGFGAEVGGHECGPDYHQDKRQAEQEIRHLQASNPIRRWSCRHANHSAKGSSEGRTIVTIQMVTLLFSILRAGTGVTGQNRDGGSSKRSAGLRVDRPSAGAESVS